MLRPEQREVATAYGLAAVGAVKAVGELAATELQHQGSRGRLPRPAYIAWGALISGVFAYDMLAPPNETLSEGVDSAIERSSLLTNTAIAATALHLANILPERVDPIHQVGKRARHAFRARIA